MSTTDTELRDILKNFLDATDYALEAPEEQADDAEWFERPYQEALTSLRNAIIKALIIELENLNNNNIGHGRLGERLRRRLGELHSSLPEPPKEEA